MYVGGDYTKFSDAEATKLFTQSNQQKDTKLNKNGVSFFSMDSMSSNGFSLGQYVLARVTFTS